jgi:hypothetical protein
MLSELVKIADETLRKDGDMIVWLETEESGYEHDEVHKLPGCGIEVVSRDLAKEHNWWPVGSKKTFVIYSP